MDVALIIIRRILLITGLLTFFIVPVSIVQAHSLVWGITTSDVLEYSYYSTGFNRENVSDVLRVEFNESLPSIPPTITSWEEIPVPTTNITWSDGTVWPDPLSIMDHLYSFVLPIGNWSIMSWLAWDRNATFEFPSVVELDNSWFYSFYHNSSQEKRIYVSLHYSTSDGALRFSEVSFDNPISDEKLGSIYLERIVPLPDNRIYFFIYFGVFFVSLVIVIKLARKYL